MKRRWMMLGMVLLPLAANAAEGFTLEASGTVKAASTKKFLPLGATEHNAGMVINKEREAFSLNSDRKKMEGGSLRLDRRVSSGPAVAKTSHVKPVVEKATQESPAPIKESAAQAAPSVVTPDAASYEPESEEITGNTEGYHDPVLALFDGDSSAALSSFSEVMRGGQTASRIAGVVRHLIWPIPLDARQYVSSGYGLRKDPFHGRPTFHGGLDIAADTGTAVLATADGQVTEVKTDANYGKYITLQHADGMLTRYGHLAGQQVTVGQRVRAGQAIGTVGATGRATGAHLDYRVSKNGMKFDPMAVLSRPSSVAMKAPAPLPGGTKVASAPRAGVATNATPKRAMVIQVR